MANFYYFKTIWKIWRALGRNTDNYSNKTTYYFQTLFDDWFICLTMQLPLIDCWIHVLYYSN